MGPHILLLSFERFPHRVRDKRQKVTKEKSPAIEKLTKIILASLQEKKLPLLKQIKSFGSSGSCRIQTAFPATLARTIS